jgi:hypothetical protein
MHYIYRSLSAIAVIGEDKTGLVNSAAFIQPSGPSRQPLGLQSGSTE